MFIRSRWWKAQLLYKSENKYDDKERHHLVFFFSSNFDNSLYSTILYYTTIPYTIPADSPSWHLPETFRSNPGPSSVRIKCQNITRYRRKLITCKIMTCRTTHNARNSKKPRGKKKIVLILHVITLLPYNMIFWPFIDWYWPKIESKHLLYMSTRTVNQDCTWNCCIMCNCQNWS